MLASKVGQFLLEQQAMLSTAESCTGGLLASTIIDIAGSSQWFERGFVTYSNQAKIDELVVPLETLAQYGAVSEQTAQAMVRGVLLSVLKHATASHPHIKKYIALSTTGVADPTGGSAEKPVGMVCFGLAIYELNSTSTQVYSTTQHFNGSRTAIREQAVAFCLEWLLEVLSEN